MAVLREAEQMGLADWLGMQFRRVGGMRSQGRDFTIELGIPKCRGNNYAGVKYAEMGAGKD